MANGTDKMHNPAPRFENVPREFPKSDPILLERLIRDFGVAYMRVARFWERKLHTVPAELSPSDRIVRCFMWEWVSMHTSSAVTSQCSDEELISALSPTDSFVRHFIATWAEKHSAPVSDRQKGAVVAGD